MAFLKAVRSNGKSDVLINLDHVEELRPLTKGDRRTKVTLADRDEEGKAVSFNIDNVFDDLNLS